MKVEEIRVNLDYSKVLGFLVNDQHAIVFEDKWAFLARVEKENDLYYKPTVAMAQLGEIQYNHLSMKEQAEKIVGILKSTNLYDYITKKHFNLFENGDINFHVTDL